MNPRCPAPEIQTAVLDEVRNAQELPSDLALHLDQCVACQIQVERLRRMAAVWTGDEVDDDALALAEAKFIARRGTRHVTVGWFDVVPFASAGVAAGLLLLVATGTVDLPWKSRAASGPSRGPADMHATAAPKGLLPSDAPRVPPVFAASEETAKRVRAQAHVETTRGVAPLVHGLRIELQRGESAKIALNDGHASTVEGPCLVEFWSTPTEVGGWRMVREEAPARDERSPEPSTAPGEHANREESSAAETRAASDEGAARENSAVPGQAATESPGAVPGAPAPASGASPSPAASSGRHAANEGAVVAGTPSKKSTPANREGSVAAALDETVANNTQAVGSGVSLGSVRAWERAASALREDDFEGADRAFDELSHSANPSTRDAARLARAQLWMSRGREREVRPVLEQLAEKGATPLVRRRATELLYRDVH